MNAYINNDVLHYREAMDLALEVMAEAAHGNLEARVLRTDFPPEQQRFLERLNHLLDVVDAYVRESTASMKFASQGRHFRRVMARGLPGSFRAGARVLNSATSEMARQASELNESVASRRRLADQFEAAVGQVVVSVAQSAEAVRDVSTQLLDLAGQVSKRASSMDVAAEQTCASIETIAAATEELTASSRHIETITAGSSEVAAQAVETSRRATESVTGLSTSVAQVGSVVKAIGEVASQTRMLALNANIEAARAGPLGRGFAVVASEVKGLAHQTALSTEDISQRIEAVQQATRESVGAIGSIGSTLIQVEELARTVAEAVRQQELATSDISRSIHQAASVTRSVKSDSEGLTAAAEATNAACHRLREAADQLGGQVAQLKTRSTEFAGQVRA